MDSFGPMDGHSLDPGELDAKAALLRAMEEHHPLPGFYPVVVIAIAGEAFAQSLITLVESHLGEAPYRLATRDSSQGLYVSYHLDVFVIDAESVLVMKEAIALMEGVRVLL